MKNSTIVLTLLTAIIAMLPLGCAQSRQQTEDTSMQIKPTLVAQSVVYYYKSDRSAYITNQRQSFNPIAGYFEMSASEPTGRIYCSLDRDKFISSGKNSASLSDLPGSFCNKNLATAVFYSFCAGANLLDAASMTTLGDDIKIEGQWYTPLRPVWPDSPKLTLYRSQETNRIELTRLDDETIGQVWMLRGYNFRYSTELGSELPRMIDVFNIDNGIASKELMIRIDYKDIRKASTAG